jgi:acetylornithine deacetylase/succinyl-diaminopimelate desuccinylase-like protein
MSFVFSESEREEALKTYLEFLQRPSISASGEGVRDTANYLRSLLSSLGVEARVEETGGHPVVYGEYKSDAKQTLLVYNHYDVQPVDPLDEWRYPPFSAKIDGGKVYARGASDNKGTLIARLYGFKKLVTERKLDLNLKFLFEGEEEIGSPSLEEYVAKNKNRLVADAVIMEGGGLDAKGRPQVVLGVKGLLYVEITCTTGIRDLHSSNAPIVYNPAWELTKLLSSLVGDDGRIRIQGFYDDVVPLTEPENQALRTYDTTPEDTLRSLGVKKLRYTTTDDLRKALFTEPTCNIDGFSSGYTGPRSKTIVPAKATVKLDFRLVPNQDPQKIFEQLRKHIEAWGFDVELKLLSGERPVRTSPETRVARAMVESARKVYRVEPVVLPNSAGTQPMSVFTHTLGIRDAVSAIGAGSASSAAHAPNENVDIENFYKAIQHSAEFFYIYPKVQSAK